MLYGIRQALFIGVIVFCRMTSVGAPWKAGALGNCPEYPVLSSALHGGRIDLKRFDSINSILFRT